MNDNNTCPSCGKPLTSVRYAIGSREFCSAECMKGADTAENDRNKGVGD